MESLKPGTQNSGPEKEKNRQPIHATIGLQWNYSCDMKTIIVYDVNPLQKQICFNVFRHQLDIMTVFKSGSLIPPQRYMHL